mmetsp:Transcript_69293/g.130302  ORF Transcript_69293/g.130302 Transcript_69293/m.130302 type:complete len:305 (-) Transcript_69293:1935-2849(-)
MPFFQKHLGVQQPFVQSQPLGRVCEPRFEKRAGQQAKPQLLQHKRQQHVKDELLHRKLHLHGWRLGVERKHKRPGPLVDDGGDGSQRSAARAHRQRAQRVGQQQHTEAHDCVAPPERHEQGRDNQGNVQQAQRLQHVPSVGEKRLANHLLQQGQETEQRRVGFRVRVKRNVVFAAIAVVVATGNSTNAATNSIATTNTAATNAIARSAANAIARNVHARTANEKASAVTNENASSLPSRRSHHPLCPERRRPDKRSGQHLFHEGAAASSSFPARGCFLSLLPPLPALGPSLCLDLKRSHRHRFR